MIAIRQPDHQTGERQIQEYAIPDRFNGTASDLFVDPSESIWVTFEKKGQIAHFNPINNAWTDYSPETTNRAIAANSANRITLAEDSSVRITTLRDGLIHLYPSETGRPPDAEILVYLPQELQGDYLGSIAIDRTGAVWIAGHWDVIRCDAEEIQNFEP